MRIIDCAKLYTAYILSKNSEVEHDKRIVHEYLTECVKTRYGEDVEQ